MRFSNDLSKKKKRGRNVCLVFLITFVELAALPASSLLEQVLPSGSHTLISKAIDTDYCCCRQESFEINGWLSGDRNRRIKKWFLRQRGKILELSKFAYKFKEQISQEKYFNFFQNSANKSALFDPDKGL